MMIDSHQHMPYLSASQADLGGYLLICTEHMCIQPWVN